MRRLLGIIFIGCLLGCNEDNGPSLPSADERAEAAKRALVNELVSPSNGWIINYQPTPESGIFPMVLDFSSNGEVNILSDVAENDGEFFDHTITYRIDNALSLELVLETYGVFHFLFEQNQASFGAEFQFNYVGKVGNDLIFQSASDISSSPTQIVFQPAQGNEENNFGRDISGNLNTFPIEIAQQLQLDAQGISLFLNINSSERTVQVNTAAVGLSIEDIVNDNKSVNIDQNIGYTLSNESMVLVDPLEFILDGRFYSIEQISLNDFDPEGTAGFCSLSPETLPEYEGFVPGLGNAGLKPTVFDPLGAAFQPDTDPYTVNIPFIFDGQGQSLAQPGGIIDERFPEATGFIFYYGSTTPGEPEYGAGFILNNESGETDIFVREFLPVLTTDGNKIIISFTNQFFHTGTAGPEDEADLTEITDMIFTGSELYAQDFPIEGLTVFILYNPCNNYQVFLVD